MTGTLPVPPAAFATPDALTEERFKWALSVQWSRLLRSRVRRVALRGTCTKGRKLKKGGWVCPRRGAHRRARGSSGTTSRCSCRSSTW